MTLGKLADPAAWGSPEAFAEYKAAAVRRALEYAGGEWQRFELDEALMSHDRVAITLSGEPVNVSETEDRAEMAALVERLRQDFPEGFENAADELPDAGAMSGTTRILVAAVQRLAEENAALAAEVDALREGKVRRADEAARGEALEAVERHRAQVADFSEAADERQTAAGDAFAPQDEELPEGWADQGERVGEGVYPDGAAELPVLQDEAGDTADDLAFPNATW